jgi:transposase
LPLRHRHAGGADLGLRGHRVAAPHLADGTPQVAAFDTDSLEALADWLAHRGVSTVAPEATGVYGEPLRALLQARGFAVLLVAPRYTQGLQGRPKTDRRDGPWIQRLHAHGLWPASFRPADAVAVLRPSLRQRAELVRDAARHIPHRQKALEQRNLKLPEVLSDRTGRTGRTIIQAILAGERDPLTLARLRDQHCRHHGA